MAPRKSIPKLEEMCWEIAVHRFRELHSDAQFLPTFFIDELCMRLNKSKPSICLDNMSKMFFHPKAKDLFQIPFFCLYESEEHKKLWHDWKNLRRIVLPYSCGAQPELITSIIVNNPLLSDLDLSGSLEFTDNHFLIISKCCTQLKYLRVKKLKKITDECMNNLPTTLTFLNVKYTGITPRGCIIALNRLKSLKELKHQSWNTILEILMRQQQPKPIFSIECFKLYGFNRNINLGKIIVIMFPQLRCIRLFRSYFSIWSLIENQKLHLITDVAAFIGFQDFFLIGKLCPMLEKLSVWFPRIYFRLIINDTTSRIDDYVPFKRLRRLKLWLSHDTFQLADLKVVLAKVKWLKSLEINSWRQLEDRVIDNVLESNLLQGIERIEFDECGPFTVAALIKILRLTDSLKFMMISYCENISVDELSILKKVINDENWDVTISHRLPKC